MSFLKFNNVNFAFPRAYDAEGKRIVPPAIFAQFTADFPAGFVHLVGPNGVGKSTFMLLAAGRLLPITGSIELFGKNTKKLSDKERDECATFLYQNMELETEQTVEQVLQYVYHEGLLKGAGHGIRDTNRDLLEEIKEVFEVAPLEQKKFPTISKGEMQRMFAAFSMLYGSRAIFMDEPFFAMEDRHKHIALQYLKEYSEATCVSIYISMHDLDLTRKYAEKVMLFYPNRDIDLGTVEEVLTDDSLEKAYGVPVSMLRQSEELSREQIKNRIF